MARLMSIGGHPLHPVLVHFPIAFWSAGTAADLAGWLLGQPAWWNLSFGCQALGEIAAIPAMLAGAVEFRNVPSQQRVRDIAVWHILAMTTAWLLYLTSLALRHVPFHSSPMPWATVAATAGFVAMAAGGWFGGQLVYRFGVGTSVSDAGAGSPDKRR